MRPLARDHKTHMLRHDPDAPAMGFMSVAAPYRKSHGRSQGCSAELSKVVKIYGSLPKRRCVQRVAAVRTVRNASVFGSEVHTYFLLVVVRSGGHVSRVSSRALQAANGRRNIDD